MIVEKDSRQSNDVDTIAALRLLHKLPANSCIGAAITLLIEYAEKYPDEFRRIMNERVIREGFTGISLLEYFNRTCR